MVLANGHISDGARVGGMGVGVISKNDTATERKEIDFTRNEYNTYINEHVGKNTRHNYMLKTCTH